jgi:acyl carrier protein
VTVSPGNSNVSTELERFIRRESRVDADDPDFTRQVNLFDAGYLDSLGVVHLIAHLESTYDMEISNAALADPAFVTIDGIAAVVESHLRTERSNA